MFILAPVNGNIGRKSNAPLSDRDDKLLIAARLKCSCQTHLRAEYGINAVDLNDLEYSIKQALFERFNGEGINIPLIDPESVNQNYNLIFITDFDKNVFRTWSAMDLLTLKQFYEYAEKKQISIQNISIGS